MRVLVLLMLAMSVSGAVAQEASWKVLSSRDRMNDRDAKYADLRAKAPDHGITAILSVQCSKAMEGRYFTLTLSRRIIGTRVDGSYRVDDEPEEVRHFFVSNGVVAFIEAPRFDLINRRRFRVQLQIPRQPTLFYDFDLNGLKAASKAIGCG